ncbi:MAG: DNA replication and repair protein RecF [Candidatus Latescibacteria bacterium]|nr:DNA replication and repair protein RecF [Candidatus Latescibacterota bacterium]
MRLEQIQIEGVRNLADTEIHFDSNVNYIFGNNGAGKTSILEAIHYLAIGRSFRTSRDAEIVRFNAPFLKITGVAYPLQLSQSEANDKVTGAEKIEAEIRYFNGVKTAYLQKQKQDKLSAYLGWLPVVTILLSDIELVSGPPDRRRNFVDLAIAKTNKTYLKNLIEYRSVLLQRNKLLMGHATNSPAQEEYYEVWEESLAKLGSEIINERIKQVPLLLDEAQKFYAEFIKNRRIIFEYKSQFNNNNDVSNIQDRLLELLKQRRAQDKELGHTTIGPHRDDIIIKEKNQFDADKIVRRFGSEGEQRLAALSLKMAEAQKLSNQGKQPIFLLDEFASELDMENTRKLFELIQGQFFYATAKAFKDIINRTGKTFYVEKGEIKKTETTG